MNKLLSYLRHPIGARFLPFAVFVGLTFLQGQVASPGQFWLYAAKVVVGGWLLWQARGVLDELQWRFSWEAVVVGIGVFVLWVGLDPLLQLLGIPNSFTRFKLAGSGWNPIETFGAGSAAAWVFIIIRIGGITILVPMLEEIFYRSFLYRYLEKQDFLSLSLRQFSLRPFLITAAVFGVAHVEWLAGILTGLAYQGLVLRKGRLGDAITAHAITNLLLGVWVVWKGAWQYW